MPKIRTTLTIDASVMKAIRVKAARSGKGDSEVIEDAVRRSLGLGLFERMWEDSELSEPEAMELALEAQRETRPV